MGKNVSNKGSMWPRIRAPLLTSASTAGVSVFVWLGFSPVPFIGLVPLAIVLVLAAVLFSPRDEPSRRLERLIKLFRRTH